MPYLRGRRVATSTPRTTLKHSPLPPNGPPSDDVAVESLAAHNYGDMRALARELLRRHPGPDAVQPTSLVHETFIRLAGTSHRFADRQHFLAIAARAMRFVLVDQARRQSALKRGAGHVRIPLDENISVVASPDLDLLALDAALDRLAEWDARKARIVELRIFGGQTVRETSRIVGLSPATVKREWVSAKAWLYREVTAGCTRSSPDA